MNLPRILSGRRRWWFLRLLGLSIIEALTLFAVAILFRELLIALHTLGPTGLPAHLPVALALSAVLIALTHWGANSTAERLGMDYSNALRLVLLRSCVTASQGAQPQRLGTSMARMIGDLAAVRDWISQGLATSMIASATLAAAFAGLAAIDPQLALHLAAASLILILVLAPLSALRLYRLARELRRLRGRLSSRLGDLVLAAATVAHLGRYRSEARRVDRHNQALLRASVARTRTLGLLTALTVVMVPATVAWVSLLLAKGHPLPMQQPGAWTTLLFTVSLLSVSLTGLVRSLDQWINFIVARRRLLQLMQTARKARPPRQGRQVLPRGQPLSLHIHALADLDMDLDSPLHAPAGSTVALVGASGLGKSQLLRHLLQARDNASDIRIAGLPLADIAPASLRKRVQWVTPAFALMRGSLLRNLRYAAPIKRQRLQRLGALCRLNIADTQAARAQRLDQAGTGLPSSLAARIRLARALAARPGVLLVDDAAFLYDPLAQQALRAVQAEGIVTLVIAAPDEQCVAVFEPDVVWRLAAGDQGVQVTAQGGRLAAPPSSSLSVKLLDAGCDGKLSRSSVQNTGKR